MGVPRLIKGLAALLLAQAPASADIWYESVFEIGLTYRPEDYYEALRIGASLAHFPWERVGYLAEWESGYWSRPNGMPFPDDGFNDYAVNAWRAGPIVTLVNTPAPRSTRNAIRIDAAAGVSYASWNLTDSDMPNRRGGGVFVGVYPKIWRPKENGMIVGVDFVAEQSPAGWDPDIKLRIGYRF